VSIGHEAEEKVQGLLSRLIVAGGSDVHFDPSNNGTVSVKFRINGVLVEVDRIPVREYRYMETWIKGKSAIPKQEKKNWDGRLDFRANGTHRSFRVATSWAPVGDASKITMRLLPEDIGKVPLERLGFFQEDLNALLTALNSATGIIIVSGPTGSGKTTTLYSAMSYVRDRHVLTIEDPIEAPMEGVNQLEVRAGVASFHDHMKAAVRHDPDVILVGEIRDGETASVAVSAALSGHLVLGTVHANSGLVTVTRMADLGADVYNLAFSLRISTAQRLLPALCPECRQNIPLSDHLAWALKRFAKNIRIPSENWTAEGCDYCNGTGVSGRVMVYELFAFDEEDRALIYDTLKKRLPFEDQMKRHFQKKYGTMTLLERAIERARKGDVSLESVLRYCL